MSEGLLRGQCSGDWLGSSLRLTDLVKEDRAPFQLLNFFESFLQFDPGE
jgi:hypothetical protein